VASVERKENDEGRYWGGGLGGNGGGEGEGVEDAREQGRRGVGGLERGGEPVWGWREWGEGRGKGAENEGKSGRQAGGRRGVNVDVGVVGAILILFVGRVR